MSCIVESSSPFHVDTAEATQYNTSASALQRQHAMHGHRIPRQHVHMGLLHRQRTVPL